MLSDDDDGSSLSELSEEEDFAPTKKEKKGRGKKGVFALKKVLKIPRQTTYSTQALYGMYVSPQRWRDYLYKVIVFCRGDHAREGRFGPGVPTR